MSGFPSLWNLLISTLMFFLSVWYIRRYLDEQGIPRRMTRGMLVFTLACVVSWVSGELIDRVFPPQAHKHAHTITKTPQSAPQPEQTVGFPKI